ncbi:MAG: cytochrome c3 family protein [Gemmatimonadota bacterium]
MRRLSGLLRRSSRPARIAVQAGILVLILVGIGVAGFVEYSAQPSFCLNCHVMRPYYESWAASSHNDVPCIQCHYAPGIRAEAMGKFQAANQVVKYVTGAYGTKPWAEIEDAACLRSGCHSERKLEGAVGFRGVRFDHATHLTDLRRGKRLRCTACHSQIVQGEHVAVTEKTCFLCHFKDRPPGDPVAGCTGCHTEPPRVTSASGTAVDHEPFVRDLVSCVSCHERVTSGSGAADRARCFNCHNEPDEIAAYADTVRIHEVHLAEHNVECAQCHVPIEHRIQSLSPTFELDCGGCHERPHEAERQVYAGVGGHGAGDLPSSMYEARVSCQSCHLLPSDIDGHAGVKRAGEATCLSCHGTRYAGILPSWQRELERRTSEADGTVRKARAAAPRSGAAGARADSLLRLAEENLSLLRAGHAVHNVPYADALLRAAVDFASRAAAAGRPSASLRPADVGPSVRENECLRCHLGVERREVPLASGRFDHAPHVLRAKLECTACHTPVASHGGTTIRAPAGCDTCHDRHHATADRKCAACHREGVRDRHVAGAAHFRCSVCHGDRAAGIDRWTRQVCLTCHDDRREHYAPADCRACHQVPEMN